MTRVEAVRSLESCCVRASLVLLLAAPVAAQLTSRVSLDSAGVQGNADSFTPSISADGRWTAFESTATNLVAGDTNAASDVFVRDRQTGTTTRVSVDSAGVEGNGDSYGCAISADGRFVAFKSGASNLVAGDTNAVFDIFVHDRQTGTTERVSVGSGGVEGNGASGVFSVLAPAISADGRYVAFDSAATNLVAADTNGTEDVFVRDRQSSTTERASIASGGAQGTGNSYEVAISADGRYVGFRSYAANLVAGDTNADSDVFLRDRQAATTERVSIDSGGVQGNNRSGSPSISSDGRYVAFASLATNLVPGDTNLQGDLFVRDRVGATTERVSVATGGAQGNNAVGFPSITPDGRYVAFYAFSTNLVPGDTNGFVDVFVRDRQNATTERVSLDSGGAQGNADSGDGAISADGRFVAFTSVATNLVGGDTNAVTDVFFRDRNVSGFTSICHPGVAGVQPCPCSNPPGATGRGCNNSAATGGAMLTASGLAYLSADSLVFTTSGEKPTALSTVWQGPSTPPAGIIFGQGIRCANGALKRLYNKNAVGGSITAPNFGAGDPTVSVRSAARGDVIGAGQTRYYFVSYRDPIVLGGCPVLSTFNATQTGRVVWSN